MKQILLIFLAFILSVSTCKGPKNVVVKDLTMISYDDTLRKAQLDSLFITDTISFDIENDWIQSITISENRKDMMYKYVYIKNLTDSTQLIYTLCTYKDTLFIINKRLVE